MKKTKIIATAGPATDAKSMIKEMILNGVNVIRINMSHATHEYAKNITKIVRSLNKELDTNVGILVDTKGPEIRIGSIVGDLIVEKDDTVVFTNRNCFGEDNNIHISYKDLYKDVSIGDRILVEDGLLEFKVIEKDDMDIICNTINGGKISSNKAVNAPDSNLNMDFLSIVDKEDIAFASAIKADFIALSFVRSSNDVLDVNDILIGLQDEYMQIIAKIENKNAIEDIGNIIKVSDGIMIARGDLGVEIPLEEVPSIQKRIVKESFLKGKICIVATEMLSSMEDSSRPTRAEVSDVANAVIDGVDAVMLSGETAMGSYPIETISTMRKIIESTEATLDYDDLLRKCINNYPDDIASVISHSVVDAANMLNTKAIVATTMSGYTAKKISSYRPCCPIIATTPRKETATSLSLNWGVIPIVVNKFKSTDEIIENAIEVAKDKLNLIKEDKIIITGGFPIKNIKYTNFLKIEEIG
jgi:pyruvate kinase